MAITKLVITGNTTAVGLSSDPLTISLVERTPANLVSVASDDNITATNVQDALEQLDDIKAPIASPSFTGNVGIGTDSPDAELHVADAGSNAVIRIESSNSHQGNIFFDDQAAANVGKIGYDHSDNSLQFDTSSTEAMRIDSSGKLLLNTATHTLTDSEMVVASEYSASGTTTGGITLSSRQSGSWRNSGIFANGTDLTFTTGDTGLNGAQASSERMRIDSSGVVHVYEGIDFGGAVNSGGTVSSSNKLDDYEEGTWTPAASGYVGTLTVNSAAYTKIGRLVHLRASVTFSDTADGSIIQITGLPFAQGSASTGRGGSVTRDTSGSVAFTDGSASTILRMLSNTHSTVTYTAVRGATVEFFHIYDA